MNCPTEWVSHLGKGQYFAPHTFMAASCSSPQWGVSGGEWVGITPHREQVFLPRVDLQSRAPQTAKHWNLPEIFTQYHCVASTFRFCDLRSFCLKPSDSTPFPPYDSCALPLCSLTFVLSCSGEHKDSLVFFTPVPLPLFVIESISLF